MSRESEFENPPGPSSSQCDVCGKMFWSKRRGNAISNLKRHFKTVHLKLKPFPCTKCDMKFGEKSIRDRHAKTVHWAAHLLK